jgi:hypothetical protein
VSDEANFRRNSSYFADVPDTLSSIANLTFALNNCFAKSGSLAAIPLEDGFFKGGKVAEECDLDIPFDRSDTF